MARQGSSARSGRVNRRHDRREERRSAIVAIAQRAFSEQGYGGTSMSAIAARMGGSKATLWAYFPSKKDLFAAALNAWIEESTPARRPDWSGDLRSVLICYCAEFMRAMLSPTAGTMFRLVAAEGRRFPELGREFYKRVPRRQHCVLAGLLEDEIRAGRLRASDSLRAAEQLHSLCICGLVMRHMCGPEPDATEVEIEREVVDAVDLFLNGYGVRPERGDPQKEH